MAADKLVSFSDIIRHGAQLKQSGVRVGLAFAAFECITPGRLRYLQEARAECDVLFVGVQTIFNDGRLKDGTYSTLSCADLIAGLSCVDVVFIDSTGAADALKAICPDILFVDSAIPEQTFNNFDQTGGKIVRISQISEDECTSCLTELPRHKIEGVRPAIFVDRDGTMIDNVDCLKELSDIKFLKGALEGLRRLWTAGFDLFMVTNQPGLSIGMISHSDLVRVSRFILEQCDRQGAPITKIYYCPHTSRDNCDCRKPKSALIELAVREFSIDKGSSYIIGDMTCDIMLGNMLGIRAIMVNTGHAGADGRFNCRADFTAADLTEAAEWIISDYYQRYAGR